VGWSRQASSSAGSLMVAPGEPGIDTSSAGALLIGDNNATAIEIGAATTLAGNTTITNLIALNGIYDVGTVLALDLSVAGRLAVASHLAATAAGTPTTSALGANVTSVTPTGNDVRGTIAIVMAGVLAANTRIATVTFANNFGATAPVVLLINQTAGAGLGVVTFYRSAFATGVSFDLACDQALALGTYTIGYLVIG